jgi:ureidoacrylate peracid hydrolase
MSTPVFERDLTGLLVVDPYNDFISEGGILWPLVKEIAEAVHCVRNMFANLQAAGAARVRAKILEHAEHVIGDSWALRRMGSFVS